MTLRAFFVFIIAITAVFVACVGFSTQAYALLDSWKLIPHDEPFTELYIDDYIKLPTQTVSGQLVPFSFTVHNLEGRPMTYPYNVYAVMLGHPTTTLSSGSIPLDDGKFAQIISAYRVKSTTSTEIFIELPQNNLSLHFMVPRR